MKGVVLFRVANRTVTAERYQQLFIDLNRALKRPINNLKKTQSDFIAR